MSSDWVPKNLQKGGNDVDTNAAMAQLMDATNERFAELGVSTSMERRGGEASLPVCAECGKKITNGRVLNAMDATYHPDCFVCSQCNRPFDGGSYSVRGGQPWCGKCIEWTKREAREAAARAGTGGGGGVGGGAAAAAAAAPVTVTTTRTVTNAVQQAAHDEIQRSRAAVEADTMQCASCGNPILGQSMSYSEDFYHPECFSCSICNGAITPGKKFLLKNKKPYHKACWDANNVTTCGVCGKALSGKYVVAMGAKYHKECFVCKSCGGSVAGGFVMRRNAPYCGGCAANAPPEIETETVPRDKPIRGIRVDPITREVRQEPAPAPSGAAGGIKNKFCPSCGTKVSSKFCGNCGTKQT